METQAQSQVTAHSPGHGRVLCRGGAGCLRREGQGRAEQGRARGWRQHPGAEPRREKKLCPSPKQKGRDLGGTMGEPLSPQQRDAVGHASLLVAGREVLVQVGDEYEYGDAYDLAEVPTRRVPRGVSIRGCARGRRGANPAAAGGRGGQREPEGPMGLRAPLLLLPRW